MDKGVQIDYEKPISGIIYAPDTLLFPNQNIKDTMDVSVVPNTTVNISIYLHRKSDAQEQAKQEQEFNNYMVRLYFGFSFIKKPTGGLS